MRTTPVENKERNKRRRAVNQSYLKAMDKNTHNHAARNAGRILKYGASGFRRNIWLSIAATLVMTITLLILCATAFASSVLSSTAQSMREKIDIAIYFKPGTDAETLEELKTIMAADSNVRNVTVSTSEAEYDNLVAQNDNEELQTALADEDMKEQLITAMQAAMRVQVYDTENLDGIKNIVNNNELFVVNLDPDNVPTYDSNREQIQTITNWANIAKNGGLILGAVFLVISTLVIFNTIRMAIFSRREEIYMMKLVGASPSFIRGPFLVEAQICGLISGLCACVLAFIAYETLKTPLTNYGIDLSGVTAVMESSWIIVVALVIIAIGVLIGLISSRLAIRRYLK